MTSMTPRPKEWTFRRVVAELPFIPATSNWLKLLFSLLAEPLMFLSSLYIIAETVIPDATTWPPIFLNGTKTVMSLGPEIILPGCFQQAQQAHRDVNPVKGTLLFCLCAVFGLLTLVTLASFIWHFSGAIDSLILFVRCGAGISYTIILNISGQEELATHPLQIPTQPPQNDRIAQLAETVNTLTTQLTTVLQVTQNNNFLVSPLQETLQAPPIRETPLPQPPQALQIVEAPSPSLSTPIHPLRLTLARGSDLHLLSPIAQQIERVTEGLEYKMEREASNVGQMEPRNSFYPRVAGVSPEKVKQLLDAFLSGTKWRDLPGNYSQTIKPVREAWEGLHTPLQ